MEKIFKDLDFFIICLPALDLLKVCYIGKRITRGSRIRKKALSPAPGPIGWPGVPLTVANPFDKAYIHCYYNVL